MGKNWLVNVYKWSLRIAAALVSLIAAWLWYKSRFKDASWFLFLSAGFPFYYLSCFNLDEEEKDPEYPTSLIIPKVFFFFGFSIFIYVTTTIFWGVNLPGFILATFLFYASTRLFLHDLKRWKKKRE